MRVAVGPCATPDEVDYRLLRLSWIREQMPRPPSGRLDLLCDGALLDQCAQRIHRY